MKPTSLDDLINMLTKLKDAESGSLDMGSLKIRIYPDNSMGYQAKHISVDMGSFKLTMTCKTN